MWAKRDALNPAWVSGSADATSGNPNPLTFVLTVGHGSWAEWWMKMAGKVVAYLEVLLEGRDPDGVYQCLIL